MKRVLILSVNYNSRINLACLFESIRKLERDGIELSGLMLDVTHEVGLNDMPDGFLAIKIPENRGYAYALNIGLKMAENLGVDYCWVLNPDVVLTSTSLTALIDVTETNPNTIIGSSIYTQQADTNERLVWGKGGYVDSNGDVSMGNSNPSELLGAPGREFFECDYVPGCSMFFPVSILKSISYLPEDYFLYFEETEWCLRAKAKGVKSLIATRSEVYHEAYPGKLQEPFRVYFYNRGKKLFLWRNKSYFGIGKEFIISNLKSMLRLVYSVWAAPPTSRSTFLAHLYSVLDLFLITLFVRDRRTCAKLSRKRQKQLTC